MDRKKTQHFRTMVTSARERPAYAMHQFYVRFKRVYATFLESIEGIANHDDCERYATLLLNRLLFTYFLQKKGLLGVRQPEALDGDPHYLVNRLRMTQISRWRESPDAFYHSFLLRLFHEGFRNRQHSPELQRLLGRVPYLGESLFQKHDLERRYSEITIPDQAFKQLFAFLDKFAWHGDQDPPCEEEINLEILGPLCEQDSNQKQTGAYFTAEDITGYIGKNTIISFILESARQKCPAAFIPDSSCWLLLQENPDAYLYDALKKGCALPLPPEIEIGIHEVEQRSAWNSSAPAEYALPGEIWREVVVRRQRYVELKTRLSDGAIGTIDDLITFNLNICQFAQDVMTHCNQLDLLYAFYESLAHVTILDPTCGSGAFLFAALNVLEPLYAVCLERMQCLSEDYANLDGNTQPTIEVYTNRMREVLSQVACYPNRRSFIYKSILTSNLYGVDLLETSAEICRFRLYLKLISAVERFTDLELFPPLACHVRVGNALVGLAHADETTPSVEFSQAKHQPFHWSTEFHEIMRKGGFDVIIGNPPYVAYNKVKDTYQIHGYKTKTCGNLYAYVLERASTLLRSGGRCGMIVPVSAISGENYRPLGQLLLQKQLWISSYSNRPDKLFAGVEQRLAILLIKDATPSALLTSPYRHWHEYERAHLFETLSYATASVWSRTGMPLKSGSARAESIFSRLHSFQGFPLLDCQQANAAVWVHNGPTYWVRALPFPPNAGSPPQRSNHYYQIPVESQDQAYALAAILSSSTFYFFYKLVSNCRDLGQKELRFFPLGQLPTPLIEHLTSLGNLLATHLKETSVQCSRQYDSGLTAYAEYYPARAKALIDEIDRVLAEHYGFSDEDLDFILNYEIKYRMGHH